ncbi:JmjC domain-containing protein [Oleomonas cavernae]|uniref:JmjC domain-containing protein n=1 Tax=Oleomonas cavernae TaxID=2320859 RepID=UPI001313E512|nr:cupin domain-containing protein [Oleomonas cavernae]
MNALPGSTLAAGGQPLLAALFGRELSAQFHDGRWPEREFAVHGDPGRLPDPLRGPALANFDALAQRYNGPLSFGRGARDARTLAIQTNAANLYRLGLTVYLHDVAPVVRGAADFLRALEGELGLAEGAARLAAFASPEDDGVSPHFDAEDVISIQLQGRKTFHVGKVAGLDSPWGEQYGPGMLPADDLYPQAGGGFPAPVEADLEPVEMVPGSVLFLPRGTWHRTLAQRDSFSLSIVLRQPAPLETLVQGLHGLLLQDPAWRRPLRRGDEARAQALLDRLPGLIARLEPRQLLVETEAQRLAGIGPDSRFQRIPQSGLRAEREGGRVILKISAWDRDWIERPTLATDISPSVIPLLDWIGGRAGAFTAGELAGRFPEAPFDFVRKLLDKLVRAQYLRLLWFPALSP